MKRIEAIIPHDLIQDVERALIRAGIVGLTLTSVYSQRMPSAELSSSRQDLLFGTPCCKLEVLVSEEEFPKAHAALAQSVGVRYSRQICVIDLESTIRIRTGESEEAAIR